MTGPEHYSEAQRLLAACKSPNGALSVDGATSVVLAAAQVHATLALAAATAMNGHGQSDGMPDVDFVAWDKVAGVPVD